MEHNGHKNRAYWSVSLTIDNNYELYKVCQSLLQSKKTKNEIAVELMRVLVSHCGGTTTPEGEPITYSAVRAHLTHLKRDDY